MKETIIRQRMNKWNYWDDGNVWLERFSDEMMDVLDETLLKVQAIADNAFNNSKIQEIRLPNNIEKLDAHSFSFCRGLKKVKLSKNIKVIPFSCFENCYSLEKVIIPEGVEEIDNYAFKECWGLKDLTLPSTITRIGSRAFYGTQIKVLNVPKTCSEIGDEVLLDGEIHFYDVNKDNEQQISHQSIIDRMIRSFEYRAKVDAGSGTSQTVIDEYKQNIQFLEDLRDGKIEL